MTFITQVIQSIHKYIKSGNTNTNYKKKILKTTYFSNKKKKET